MANTGHIFIYGYIGKNSGEVSIKDVQAKINPGFSDYIVHIISGGGDVFEGFGIYNLIKNTGKPVVTHIEGLCASIATLVAGAGDTILMNETSEFMIHNPSIDGASGDSRKLRNIADQLDNIKTLLINVYRKKTGLPEEKLWELYDNETRLNPQEAKSMGFIDDYAPAIRAVARVNINNIPMKESAFTKLLNWIRPKVKNQMTATLEDGRAIVIMADGEDPTGAQVVLETGEPLPAGEYKLATGEVLTLDDNSTITAYTQPAAPDNSNEDMKKDEEIAALKAKIAELEGASATAQETVEQAQAAEAQATARVATISNRFDLMEKEFKDLKAKALLPIGDQTPPNKKGAIVKNSADQNYDPMGEDALSYLKSRNLINNGKN